MHIFTIILRDRSRNCIEFLPAQPLEMAQLPLMRWNQIKSELIEMWQIVQAANLSKSQVYL